MFKNYLKVAIRNLQRGKVYGLINILGLAIGIACCLLIFLFVMQELRYDRFHANIDRIYRVLAEIKSADGSKRTVAIGPLPLARALQDEFPEIVKSVRFNVHNGAVRHEDNVFTERLIFTDAAIFEMFTFNLLVGDPSTVLAEPSAVVISEETAQKYFGSIAALGKTLTITMDGESAKDFIVAGITQRVPQNSSIKFDILLPIVQAPGYDSQITNWGASSWVTYVQLEDGHAGKTLESKFPPFIEKYFGERIAGGRKSGSLSADDDAWRLTLQPFTGVHLGSGIKWGLEPTSNPVYSYILSGIAFVVLLIACINFVTLAVARSAGRAKEVGMRKVLGADRMRLIQQYWAESLISSLFALVAGVFLAELFMPAFNVLANTNLSLDSGGLPSVVIALVVLMFLISLLAGGYPAILVSRFQPIAALQRRLRLGDGSGFGKALVVFQFLLSVFLISSTILMSRQLHLLKHKDLGYGAEQVVAIPTYALGDGRQRITELYKQEIVRSKKVLNVSGVNNSFTRGMMTSDIRSGDKSVQAWFYIVHDDFLKTLEIELAKGRDFAKEMQTDEKEAVIVNEALVEYFGWDQPLGKQLEMLGELRPTIIGVVRNFHFRSLHHEIEPSVIVLHHGWSNSNILIKISETDITGTLAFLEESWKKVAPFTPFEPYFLDEEVQKQYLAEERWTNIVSYASILAVVIASLGLFGLIALAASQRIKEIGVRKVLGATTANIFVMLSRDFVKLVLVANLIAWPVVWFAMSRWLQNFAYRVDISWWIFLLAGGLVLASALLTVSWQAIRAAITNPVDSLRYE